MTFNRHIPTKNCLAQHDLCTLGEYRKGRFQHSGRHAETRLRPSRGGT